MRKIKKVEHGKNYIIFPSRNFKEISIDCNKYANKLIGNKTDHYLPEKQKRKKTAYKQLCKENEKKYTNFDFLVKVCRYSFIKYDEEVDKMKLITANLTPHASFFDILVETEIEIETLTKYNYKRFKKRLETASAPNLAAVNEAEAIANLQTEKKLRKKYNEINNQKRYS